MKELEPSFSVRTDLVNETHELLVKESGTEPDGIRYWEGTQDGVAITHMEVLNQKGEEESGKPIGNYTTINIGRVWMSSKKTFETVCKVTANEIRAFLPPHGSCLFAGLGNRAIIADAVGPQSASHFVVTRHIKNSDEGLFRSFALRETSCLVPDVLGNTGAEAAELIKGAVDTIHPDFIIAVDALAARRLERLATTVQICNTGISPGSGIANKRTAINQQSMGIPVIAIGIPTVVDAVTLALDVLEEAADNSDMRPTQALSEIISNVLSPKGKNFFVTPKETDHIIKDTSKLLGYAVNAALHPDLGFDEMDEFLS